MAGNSGEIELAGLEECTLYSLDITPTAAAGGETLQPGEQGGNSIDFHDISKIQSC